MTRAVETTDISQHLPGVLRVSTDLLATGRCPHWTGSTCLSLQARGCVLRRWSLDWDCLQELPPPSWCQAGAWLRLSLNNGIITLLLIRPNGLVALSTLGDTGFMPPDKITRSWGCLSDCTLSSAGGLTTAFPCLPQLCCGFMLSQMSHLGALVLAHAEEGNLGVRRPLWKFSPLPLPPAQPYEVWQEPS